jgi:PAS domain S-box-containing protein
LQDQFRAIIEPDPWHLEEPADAAALVNVVGGESVDIVLADTDALGTEAEELTRCLKEAAPQTIVLLVMPDSSPRAAVAAMRAGAYDLFHKPVPPEEFRTRCRRAIENKRLGQAMQRRARETEQTAQERTRQVRQVREHLENLVEAAGDAIITVDPSRRITSWNRSARETLGHGRPEILGTDLLDLVSGRAAQDQMAALFRDARNGRTTSNAELLWQRKDGKELTVSLTVSPIADAERQDVAVLIIARDVTERKKLQEELFHAEKLASVGQLAAGVAHQINNPLGAISGRIQMLARRPPKAPERLQEQIGKVQSDCSRIAEIVQELLRYARKSDITRQHTDVNAILEETLEMVTHEIVARKVRVERGLASDLPLVFASANHLRQLFANLMTNACDAMDEGGVLGIRSTHRPAAGERPGGVVEVRVTDSGCGVRQEELDHIFEPFYTTKAPGKGTGLGLAVAKRIVDYHDGRIDVDSVVGSGTTFTVHLPAE